MALLNTSSARFFPSVAAFRQVADSWHYLSSSMQTQLCAGLGEQQTVHCTSHSSCTSRATAVVSAAMCAPIIAGTLIETRNKLFTVTHFLHLKSQQWFLQRCAPLLIL